MALKNFSRNDQIIGPRSVFLNGTPLGYTEKGGVDYNPAWDLEAVTADQNLAKLGHNLTGLAGTLGMKCWDISKDNYALLRSLSAGVAVTSPAAGTRFSEMPTLALPEYVIAWWGAMADGATILHAVRANLAKPPQLVESHDKATLMDLSYNLIQLSSGYPAGFTDIIAAVAGALTFTSSPADSATGVLTTAAPTFTFNKPMPVWALFAEHWTFTKDADSSAVAFTPSFGTVSVDGVTVPDPTKIVLTPDAPLAAGAAYTIAVSVAIPAVDGSRMAAAGEVGFTVAA